MGWGLLHIDLGVEGSSGQIRSHSGTLAFRTGVFSETKSVVLVKRKMALLNLPLDRKPSKNTEKSV